MNPHTGELALLRDDEERDGFDRLTGRLDAQARQKMRLTNLLLYGSTEGGTRAAAAHDDQPAPARVNLRSHTPLAQWARRKRREKIAAASRRRNRRIKKGG